MIAGEAGAELVGSVNGRTGVASNMEITGIREAILQTASEEVVLLRQQNQLLQTLRSLYLLCLRADPEWAE